MQQLLTGIFKKLAILTVFLSTGLYAQQQISLPEYIETYKHIAISDMKESGIPASIKMAQAILESGFGNSELAVNANNHFGIKCHGWPGQTYTYTDDEPDECFRKYDHPVQSFFDHSEFLRNRPRYAFLFDLDIMDYEAWAHGLSMAGYATNPRYPEMLINLIREHRLYRFDHKAMDPEHIAAAKNNQLTKRTPGQANREVPVAPARIGRRETGTYNHIRYVVARAGDTPQLLEQELDIRAWQIIRYNDVDKNHTFEEGQRIYLQPKRRKGGAEIHRVRPGDTMASISQQYGIRLENLYRRNDMTYGMEPEAGQQLLLRGYRGSALQYLFRRP
ncbi:MAG: glucosaminidase domain-containing protein [Bacteroidales bacterium]|nr:glucosaminidase domain-containing protein [Bacteroidales bacterium]